MKPQYGKIIGWFEENMPAPQPELHFENPWQLLVAVMLSAQCTDRRINMVTPALFEAFPTPQQMAGAGFEAVLPYIKPVSYPNSKCRHIVEAARMICSDFGGEVPRSSADLQQLPGVGRKTANVVCSVLYGDGVIAVDTHVLRVAHRLGLSQGSTPLAVEKDLTAGIPPEKRPAAHHWLLLHGRYVCKAQRPLCGSCGLSGLCPEFKKKK